MAFLVVSASVAAVLYLRSDKTAEAPPLARLPHSEGASDLAPAIVSGEIGGKPFAAALTPEGWVGNRRWYTMSAFEDGLAVVQERDAGKFGVIDVKGAVVIPLIYDKLRYGGGLFAAKKGESCGYLRRDGQVALPFTKEWEENEWFCSGLAPVKKDGLWGFIDVNGRFVIPPVYQDAWPHDADSGLARIQKDGLWGWVDRSGSETVKPTWYEARDFSDGRAAVRKEENGQWGFVDVNGRLVIPLEFSRASDFSEGHAEVERDWITMLVDIDGQKVLGLADIYKDVTVDDWQGLTRRWEQRNNYTDGVAVAMTREDGGEKWGAVDEKGRIIIPFVHQFMFSSVEGLIAANRNGAWGYYRPDGTVAINFTNEWDWATPFEENLAEVSKRGGLWGYINKEGTFAIPPEFDEAHPFQKETRVALTKKNGKWGLIDSKGEDVGERRHWHRLDPFFSGRARVQEVKDGLYGYVDRSGRVAIPVEYQDASPFDNDGFARARKDGRDVVLDREGRITDLDRANGEHKVSDNIKRARIEAFQIDPPVRGICKFGVSQKEFNIGEHFLTRGLVRPNGDLVEPAKWDKIIRGSDTYTIVAGKQGFFGMPFYQVRMENGELSQPYLLPFEEIEDVDNTGPKTRTGGRNIYSILPFPVSPEFDAAGIVIPPFRLSPPRTYDKVYLIAWSGLNDRGEFLEGTWDAANVFSSSGAEAHVFAPQEDIVDFRLKKKGVVNAGVKAPTLHGASIAELKELIVSIKREQQSGSKTHVTFVFASHGTDDASFEYDRGLAYGEYAIAGPIIDVGGQEYSSSLSGDILSYFARELSGCDLRFINGTCYGANTDDIFFAGYLRERSRSNWDGLFSCSSVLSNWNALAYSRTDEKYWVRHFVARRDASFLQASFAAMSANPLGAIGPKHWRTGLNFETQRFALSEGANTGMTGSERILYYDRLLRQGKFSKPSFDSRFATPHFLRGDELSEDFFSLAKATLTLPSNEHYAELFKLSAKQTEEFLLGLELSQASRAFIGIDATGRIDFRRAIAACQESTLGETWEWWHTWTSVRNQCEYLKEIYDSKSKGTPVQTSFVRDDELESLSLADIATLYRRGFQKLREMEQSEREEMQKALVLVKRLGLMLDFLNDPVVPQKRKDLFAWYRAAELTPLLPNLRK